MFKRSLLAMSLALVSLPAAFADPGCQGLPGSTVCDDWMFDGQVCDPNGDWQSVWADVYTRSCRSFDGCGVFAGSWTESRQEQTFSFCDND